MRDRPAPAGVTLSASTAAPESASLPGLLILWTTTDCNLRCRYCYAQGGDRPEYMTWEVARRALDLIGPDRGFKVQFAGGEPLLNIDLIEQVLAYTRGWNVRHQIQTNGVLISVPTARLLEREGVAVGVSLDGVPAVNDRLRPTVGGHGSTAAVIAGIRRAGAVGIRLGMTTVLSNESVEGLPDLVALASYLGNVEGISLDVLRPVGRALSSGLRVPDANLAAFWVGKALERADEIAAMRGNAVKFREVERIRWLVAHDQAREHRCYFDAGQSLMVKPDGSAYPCASLAGFAEFFLGNVVDVDAGEQILRNAARVSEMYNPTDDCRICPEWRVCGGPCPAQSWSSQESDETTSTECAVRTTFIHYARGKGHHADATRTSRVSV
ncbi:MAG: radical SAM protein [Thermoleophilia bacterium]|nr:radical SAM protein [Thermoleophilia bacterium]